jgi:hypothetical protein
MVFGASNLATLAREEVYQEMFVSCKGLVVKLAHVTTAHSKRTINPFIRNEEESAHFTRSEDENIKNVLRVRSI